MKNNPQNFFSSPYQPIIILGVLSLIIWFGGSHLSYGNHLILKEPQKRFYIIALLFLFWVLKKVLTDKPDPIINVSPEELRYLEKLQHGLTGALKFLKKTFIQKHGKNINLFQLPWHLFVGYSGAGKSSLFANAHIQYVLAKQFKDNPKQLPSSDNFDWWVTRDLVFIDVPSKFTTINEGAKNNKKKNIYWNELLKFIKKNRPRIQPLQGVSIALNIPELLKENDTHQKKEMLLSVKRMILDLRAEYGQGLSFNLVITKCDFIPGFKEFFADMGTDEMGQSWGIPIPPLAANDTLANSFNSRFNGLIKRLNKQVIYRMHHEREQNARALIKDFPLQIERLKEVVAQFIKAINIPQFNLTGVYLTSAIQRDQNIDKQPSGNLTIANNQNQNALQILQPAPVVSHAYFIKQFLLNSLLHNHFIQTATANNTLLWIKRIFFTASIASAVFICTLLGRDFVLGIQQSYSMQSLLTQYELNNEVDLPHNHLLKALPLLNALQIAAANTKEVNWYNPFNFYSQKSQRNAKQIYQRALVSIVVPEIKNELENNLATLNDKSPVSVYAMLKAYLMLSNPEKLDIDFFTHVVTKNFKNKMTQNQMSALMNHIQNALTNNKITLRDGLIDKARKSLLDLPTSELAYVILRNIGSNNHAYTLNIPLDGPNAGLTVKKPIRIPNIYTASFYQNTIDESIPRAANDALQGNDVIGKLQNGSKNPAELAALTASLNKQYISNYIEAWEGILNNIDIASAKNITELSNIASNLTSDYSPLLQLLKIYQANTHFAPINTNSEKIQSLNTLLDQQQLLYQVFVALKQFQDYLGNIAHSTNQDEAAFFACRDRVQNPTNNKDAIFQLKTAATQCPEPVKTWLRKLANRSWNLILIHTGEHIQANWSQKVYPMYAEMMNGYPFKAGANVEVDLNAFSAFLGNQGVLEAFFEQYLKPFVEVSDKDWAWKQVDNQHLAFSNEILETFEHAARLRLAFFPNGDNKLHVPFSLKPISENAKNCNLLIEGQTVSNDNPSSSSTSLSWPGNSLTHLTALHYKDENNQLTKQEYRGDWGWFRLVNQSTDSIVSRKEMVLAFNINNHAVKYTLSTQSPINPFVPLNLHKLQFPAQLVQKNEIG